MKNIICKILILSICITSIITPSSIKATELETSNTNENSYIITHIEGETEIREYLEGLGEEYDPNLVEIYKLEKTTSKDE